MGYVVETISQFFELDKNGYEKCIYPDGTVEIKDQVLSPQSCLGKIFCLKGVGKRQGLDSYNNFEVDFNWFHPKNMPVVEKTDEYRELLKNVETFLMNTNCLD